MLHITFTLEDVSALNYERYHHPHPLVQRKMHALYFKSLGLSQKEIARCLAVGEHTIGNYVKAYYHGGVAALKEIKIHRPKSVLAVHAQSLEEHFKAHPVATIKEAMAEIKNLTGIKRSETQIRQFLHKTGLRRRKVGMIPGKANPDVQDEHVKKNSSRLCRRPKKGNARCFSSMPPILSSRPFWGICGPMRGFLSARPRADSGLMCAGP